MRITKEISGNMDSKKIKYFVSNSKSIQCILKRVLENRVISTVTSWSIVRFRNIASVNIYTAKQKKYKNSNHTKKCNHGKNIKTHKVIHSVQSPNNKLINDAIPEVKPKVETMNQQKRKKANKKIKSINGNIKCNKNKIRIMQWNKGNSLIKNTINEIRDMIEEHKPEVFIINEFNLNKDEDVNITNIDGYKLEVDNLMEKFDVNRTAMYIKNNINYTRVKEVECENESVITIKIGYKNKRKIILTGYYRQWTILHKDNDLKEKSKSISEQNERFEKQSNKWKKLIDEKMNNEVLIMGDFNLDALSWEKSEENKSNYEKTLNTMIGFMKHNLLDQNMSLMHKNITRVQGNNKSCLDITLSNQPYKMKEIKLVEDTTSDHYLTIYDRLMNVNQAEEKYIKSRVYSAIDYEKINENLINSDRYWNIFNEENTDKIAEEIVQIINEELNKQSILKKRKIQNKEKEKYSKETINLIDKKNDIYKRIKKDNNIEDIREIKNIKVIIKKKKKEEVMAREKESLNRVKNNPSKLWSEAKKQMYGNQNQHPERIMENNKLVVGSKKVSQVFNRFFITKVRKMREEMSNPTEDPMISYRKYIKKPINELDIDEISMAEINKTYKKMKKSNTTGYDQISMKTINLLKETTLPLIHHLTNQIIKTGNFPAILKISRIIPIKKIKTPSLNCKDFRPINIISPISKIIEKTWAHKILNHLKKNKLIQQNHQGGLKGRSSVTATLEIHQKLSQLKKDKKNGALVCLDQSGAFDVIPHTILEKKLNQIGLSKNTTKMIMSYLKNRKQFVQINGNDSDILLTGDVSVSQGSVLSGLLYTIYVLDMPNQTHKVLHSNHSEYTKCKNTGITTYVDDCYAIIVENENDIWKDIKVYINKMNSYYINNQLQNNIKKTLVMIVSNDKEKLKGVIEINDNKIENKEEITILGTVISNKLNWNSHINKGQMSLVSQLKRRYNLLKHIVYKTNRMFAKQIANAIILSKVNYHIEVWGQTSETNRRKIDHILLKTAKLVVGRHHLGRNNKWYLNEMKWLTLKEMYETSTQKYTHRIIHGSENHFFKNYLLSNRNARNEYEEKLGPHKPYIGLSVHTQNTYLYQIITSYNKLPKEITMIRDPKIFKKWLKKYYLDKNIILKTRENPNPISYMEDEMNVDLIRQCEN